MDNKEHIQSYRYAANVMRTVTGGGASTKSVLANNEVYLMLIEAWEAGMSHGERLNNPSHVCDFVPEYVETHDINRKKIFGEELQCPTCGSVMFELIARPYRNAVIPKAFETFETFETSFIRPGGNLDRGLSGNAREWTSEMLSAGTSSSEESDLERDRRVGSKLSPAPIDYLDV